VTQDMINNGLPADDQDATAEVVYKDISIAAARHQTGEYLPDDYEVLNETSRYAQPAHTRSLFAHFTTGAEQMILHLTTAAMLGKFLRYARFWDRGAEDSS
jgi:hypothetical protein